ncbi:hypothetical protein Q31b_50200 [Novipirellula aureliae]|uniref:Uncharacterized protein n=1 Tax=Novipirellula aureliae TaxID=2527966 RepID=A0A5C6DJ37_9BACT|nr:hypothetical protein [Novipirellula aureliae]TWU36738.1 hypothetical protein Q31b_50200 [Novipirellula aureliae]
MSICQYCHSLLPSEKAQQCFACGWDWHDSSNPKQLGDPNWNRFGLDSQRDYVVELCLRPDGLRFTQYRQAETPRTDPDAVLETVPASGAQLIEWGFYKYADHLALTDGRRFTFDAHGIWLLETEAECIGGETRPYDDGNQSVWVNGIAPIFPPQ